MRRQDQQHQRHGGERFRGERGGRYGSEPWRGRFQEQGYGEGEFPRGRYAREDFETGGDWRDYGESRGGEGFGGESYADRLSRSWGGPNEPGPSQWGTSPGGYGGGRFGQEDYGRGFGGRQTQFGGPQSNWGGYGMGGNQTNPEGWGSQRGFGGQGYGQGMGGQSYGQGSFGGQQQGGFGSQQQGGFGSQGGYGRGYGEGGMGQGYGGMGGYGGQGQFGQFGGYGGQGFGQGQGQYGGQYGGQAMGQRQGPKGYTRSDERIKDDVCERLFNLGDIDVSEVSVDVQNGRVTLEGTVHERRHKHQIEDIVDQCIGVRDVENRLRVSRGGAETETMGVEAGTTTGTTRGKREQH